MAFGSPKRLPSHVFVLSTQGNKANLLATELDLELIAGLQVKQQTNFERLSSGLRINSAADDAAGSAISEGLKAQVRSLSVAERNTNNAISMSQTAESALGQVSGIMVRMRELAIQSANGDLGSVERGYLQQEYGTLASEIDRITASTSFNGINLLASSATLTFQVGSYNTANDQIAINFTAVSSGSLATASLSTQSGAQSAISTIDAAITNVSTQRASYGAVMNRLQTTVSNLQSIRNNTAAANSRIADVDVAEETASLSRNQVLAQAAVSVLAQANQSPQLALSLLR